MTRVRELWAAFRSWPWAARWTSYLVVTLALVLVAGLVTGVVLTRRPFPETDGSLTLAALDGEVEVVRDEHGIPQIYADTTADLMRAQGFVHAQDRFFEMDVRRHVTAGRTAELFGEAGVETDEFVRTMGWRRVAEQELALLEPDTRAALEAYSEGVNAYLDDRSPSELALEYTVLGLSGLDYEPEDWTPVDSLAWLKAMAWDLRGNMEDEIARVLLAVDHRRDQVEQLYPEYPYDEHAPIVRQGAVVDGRYEPRATRPGTRNPARPAYSPEMLTALEDLQRGVERMPQLLGRGEGIGSNSWVVDGDHSATGAPLLANDPHLGTSLPGIWYQVGLHCRTVSPECPYDVSGFSFSGVPGVVIGHNQDIAWGFTNLGPDVTDLFLERVEGDRWLYDGRYRRMDVRTETIEVRDGDDVELTVRSTDHGPLLSDVDSELSTVGANAELADAPAREQVGSDPEDEPYAVALRWTALDPSPTADAILGLNRAKDWDDFRAAAADFAVPAQNMVYADREGHIGYQAPGRIPIRKSGNDGRVPAEGWLPENDWSDQVVPFDALPQVLDPEEGFVVTANQAVTDLDYPYFLTGDWDYGYRSQRIREVIEDEGDVSPDEMLDLQLDDRNALAETLVPYLLDVRLPRAYYDDGQRLLEEWDFRQDADSAAAAYFNVVWRELLEMTFHDQVRESLWPDGGGRWWRVVTDLLGQPAASWWDDVETPQQETRDDMLRAALMEARDELVRRQSRNPRGWSWGALHTLDLRSQTLGESGVGAVEWLFNREGWEIGGGGSIVNATAWDAAEGYAVTAAPSMRMVVSLGDLDSSRWINLSGASGHAFHPHFTDQTDLFVEGRTLPWPFSREAVDEAAEDTLTLRPGSD
jgi:penicillin G amidase